MRRVVFSSLAVVVVMLLAACTASPAGSKASHHAIPSNVAVVSVIGHTGKAAEDELNGLFLNAAFSFTDNTLPKPDPKDFTVIDQNPKAGTTVNRGSTVKLTLKPITIAVPDVVGQTYASAFTTITGANLVLTRTGQNSNWKVTSETPPAGTLVQQGSSVTVVLAQPQIVFTITGDGSDAAAITYTKPGTFEIEQATNAALPWSTGFPYDGSIEYGNISAQDDDGTSITCTIVADGTVVDQQTATGRYAIVNCNP